MFGRLEATSALATLIRCMLLTESAPVRIITGKYQAACCFADTQPSCAD
jgi:hypothetical protein